MTRRLLWGAVVTLMLLAPVAASATTLTFDELPTQPVNGLTFMGVTFHFTIGGVPSTDAVYHGFGPGTTMFVQDPSLEGNAAGVLQLDFADPTPFLQFGTALSCFLCTLRPGFTVSLFDPNLDLLGVFPVDTFPFVSFTENQFAYDAALIQRAVLTFDSRDAARFAFDNLTYFRASEVPEPATLGLLGMGLAAILARRRQMKC